MSKPIFAELPRFDTPPEPGRLAALLQATASGSPPIYPNGDKVDAEEDTDIVDSEAPELAEDTSESELEAARYEEQLKTLLEQLGAAIDAVAADIDQQVTRATHALAIRLFPKLSEAFLADEITRHLPDLVPTPITRIELRADDAIAYRLNELISETELAGRCEIVVDPSPSESRIHVSWGSGGVVFDFDGLLQACLARLQDDREDAGVLGNVES